MLRSSGAWENERWTRYSTVASEQNPDV